jgi:hypothetical protein
MVIQCINHNTSSSYFTGRTVGNEDSYPSQGVLVQDSPPEMGIIAMARLFLKHRSGRYWTGDGYARAENPYPVAE